MHEWLHVSRSFFGGGRLASTIPQLVRGNRSRLYGCALQYFHGEAYVAGLGCLIQKALKLFKPIRAMCDRYVCYLQQKGISGLIKYRTPFFPGGIGPVCWIVCPDLKAVDGEPKAVTDMSRGFRITAEARQRRDNLVFHFVGQSCHFVIPMCEFKASRALLSSLCFPFTRFMALVRVQCSRYRTTTPGVELLELDAKDGPTYAQSAYGFGAGHERQRWHDEGSLSMPRQLLERLSSAPPIPALPYGLGCRYDWTPLVAAIQSRPRESSQRRDCRPCASRTSKWIETAPNRASGSPYASACRSPA